MQHQHQSAAFVVSPGWAARFGSGIFLIIQMVILLDFVASVNETWVANAEDDEKWLYALMTVTVAAYAGALTLAGQLLMCAPQRFPASGCTMLFVIRQHCSLLRRFLDLLYQQSMLLWLHTRIQ